MQRSIIFAFCALFAIWPAGKVAAQPLDGIAVLKIDQDVAVVLRGENFSARFLTVFVAPWGTYASLSDGGRGRRLCVAWATGHTDRTITFGLPPTQQTLKLVFPPICQPFTLSEAGSDHVHIEAADKVSDSSSGPLDPQARPRSLSTDLQVLARAPLSNIDWGADIFRRYDVRGIHLGPAEQVIASVPGQTKVTRGPIQQTSEGSYEYIRFEIPPEPRTVQGEIAAAETIRQKSDLVYRLSYSERLPNRVTTEAFAQAVADRYGAPFQSGGNASGGNPTLLHWFFGLDGRPLTMATAGPGNCLATGEFWLESYDASVEGDIGPWGCSLILSLSDDGSGDFVTQYKVTAISPYVMALNRFGERLLELNAMKEKIKAVESYRPKL